MTKLALRRANIRDAADAAACIDAAYRIYKTDISDLPPVSEGIAASINDAHVFVAESLSRIVGIIVLVRCDGFLLLENVAVHPESAGAGVGKALIARAEEECVKLGLHEMRLSTHIAMTRNVAFYSHLGWRETERSTNKVHMRKYV